MTFGKCILSSGLCSLLPEHAEPITVFSAGVNAKMFLEKLNPDGISLLESNSWMLTGWVFK